MMEQKRSITTSENDRDDNARSRTISRRDFLKLAATAGLLAGCCATQQQDTVPVSTPTSTPASPPTVTPIPTIVIRRPEIIKTYPDVPSKVVHTRHAGAWEGDDLVPEVLHDMLDAAISELTGLDDAVEAWAALFSPDERIAIKVNTLFDGWTHVPLVMAVTKRLQAAGIPAEQIVIFDGATEEMIGTGYPINQNGPGVRCYGTATSASYDYTPGWTLAGEDIQLSNILLACDALINMPILKTGYAGISFAMKNHYGTLDQPRHFHKNFEQDIPELNNLQPIRDRTRLIVGDMLTVNPAGRRSIGPGNAILMSFDPVAHDAIGLQRTIEVLTAKGDHQNHPRTAEVRSIPWLEYAAEIGLGTNDPDNMEVVEIELG
jgi:hypothetical protein